MFLPFWSKFCKMSRRQWNHSWIPIAIPSGPEHKSNWLHLVWKFESLVVQEFECNFKMVFGPIVRCNITELWTLWNTYYVLHKVLHMYYIKLGTAISHLFCLKMSTTVVCATSQLPPTNWVSIAKYYCRYISYSNKGKSLQEFQYKK